jgi:hypothetical protein
MQGDILMTDVSGYVTSANPNGGGCLIQQYGNFPRFEQASDEPGNNFEESVRAGYTFDGQFVCKGYFLSEGQSVLFDIAAGTSVQGNYAVNVRVP